MYHLYVLTHGRYAQQDVAERLGREARQRNFRPRVLSMDAFDI